MGDVFLLAVAAAFYPTLLAIVILILSRPRPVRLLAAYLAGGMIVSVGIGCLIVFGLEGAGPPRKRTADPIVDIVAGAVSILVAWMLVKGRDPRPRRLRDRQEQARAAGRHESWTSRAVSHDSPAVAFALGIVLDLPSVWYLVALKDIAEGNRGTAVDFLLILAFNLIMFVLIEVPLVAYLVAPERATVLVHGFNAWLHAHARHIAVAIAGGVGLYLLVRGVLALR
jgi:hypothetical protein